MTNCDDKDSKNTESRNMRIILSRKGWDSTAGGRPNLIFDDTGEMIMLPIPESRGAFTCAGLRLSRDEKFNDRLHAALSAYNPLVSDNGCKCHPDPNIVNLFGRDNFRGSIGQVDQSQSHLHNQGIKKGDVFVFFGLFRHASLGDDGRLTIKPERSKHSMFGYLQIGEVIFPQCIGEKEREDYEHRYSWLSDQPHWNDEKYKDKKANNCIYVAAERCSFNKTLRGWGTFSYDHELDLTMGGCEQRTHWDIPEKLKGLNITYCKGMINNKYFKAAARGQEFVIEDDEKAAEWAEELIKKFGTRNKNK